MLEVTAADQHTSAQEGSSHSKILIASIIGSVVEWYDFLVYGTASALVFNKIFFPSFAPEVGILVAFGAYAVGFVSRPLGGAIFGHFGDRIGRKAMLSLTLVIMGMGTFAIGCLPTYNDIGILSPILLVLLRFVQGIGMGGEWGGSILLAVEHAPKKRRGLFGSLVQLGYPIGVITSAGSFALLSLITTSGQFVAWGWRIPFLASILLVGIGLFIRMRVAETPAFEHIKHRSDVARVPLLEVLTKHRRSFLVAVGLKLSEIAWVTAVTIFGISYVTAHLAMPKSVVLNGILLGACVQLVSVPLFGVLSDRFGRRTLFISGCVLVIACAFPLFALLDTRSPAIVMSAIAFAIGIVHAVMFGPEAAWIAELFPARLRYSGASLGFQLGGALSGGFVPLAAASLLTAMGGRTWGVSGLLIGITLCTLWAALAAPETAGREID
jgi:MFS transporter, MHS family, shikimate and dehydroshikimate transport protein